MRARAAILAALLGAAASPGTPLWAATAVQEDPAPPADVQAALWALLSPRSGGRVAGDAELVQAIVRLGPGAVAPALAIYLGLSEEPEWGYPVDARTIGARPLLLLSALQKLPRAAVLAEVDAAVQASQDVDRRLDLCRVLARLGGADALQRVLAIASTLDPIQWERTFVQAPLQDSLSRIVRAEPKLAMQLATRVRRDEPALAAILARTLANAQAGATAAELARALGRDPALDLCLTESLGALGASAAGSLPETALEPLRRQLDASDERVVRATALALAELGDAESAARLVQLLDSPNGVVRAGVHAALKRLSGVGLPPERAGWDAWFEAERKWSQGRLVELEQILLEEDVSQIGQALLEMRQHRLFRHREALALVPALGSEDPNVVRFACQMLPTFESRAVLPALRTLATEGPLEAREHAERALRALSGEPALADTPPGS